MAEQDPAIEIRQIVSGDRLTGLSLGADFTPLKTFLQKSAKTFHEKNLARTYAAFDGSRGGRVVAYVTLVCGEIEVRKDDRAMLEEEVDYRYPHYPAIKIARLAVDSNYRGLGLGSQLVELSLGIAKSIICPAVGCRFVVVDSKKPAVNFYLKAGFTFLDTATNRARTEQVLFVDLHKT